jgi:hypothetical protein
MTALMLCTAMARYFHAAAKMQEKTARKTIESWDAVSNNSIRYLTEPAIPTAKQMPTTPRMLQIAPAYRKSSFHHDGYQS